jgi:hypothetical protein
MNNIPSYIITEELMLDNYLRGGIIETGTMDGYIHLQYQDISIGLEYSEN